MRKRTERREQERAAAKLAEQREKLFALEPGGSPSRPREVPSAAVIEVQALALACPRCGGTFKLDEHRAEQGLRVVRLICQRCGAPRNTYFRVVHPS